MKRIGTKLLLPFLPILFILTSYFEVILSLYNCASASNAMSLPPLWYQSHSFLVGDSVVVFSISPSVSTRKFGAQLLCPLLTIVGATLVVK